MGRVSLFSALLEKTCRSFCAFASAGILGKCANCPEQFCQGRFFSVDSEANTAINKNTGAVEKPVKT